MTDMAIELLLEYLSSELGTQDDQSLGGRVTRLIIVGDSFAATDENQDEEQEARIPVLRLLPRSCANRPCRSRKLQVLEHNL